jgi:dihydropteroate synthase
MRFDWQIGGRTLVLGERPLLMAILNLTPDSFSGDGLSGRPLEEVLTHALAQLDAGADILDLGAESTRPGATPLSPAEEQLRLLPALQALRQARPGAVLSVDTYHAATAQAAMKAGADIINDVSGLTWDPAMAATLAASECGVVLMHTRGRPSEWATQPRLAEEEVVPAVLRELRAQLERAVAAGIAPERIVLDPGFGFGKRGVIENFALLKGLAELQALGRPLLAGLSRKSFLSPPDASLAERDAATAVANRAAVKAGASILRVHALLTP